MKATISIALACVLSIAVSLNAVAAQKEKKPANVATLNLNFGDVADKLDLSNHTKLQAKEYWRTIQKQQVSWSGEVYEVQDGHNSRVKIYIVDMSHPLYKGYNIVVITSDIKKALAINKGQQINFTGSLDSYKQLRGGAVVAIADAQLQ